MAGCSCGFLCADGTLRPGCGSVSGRVCFQASCSQVHYPASHHKVTFECPFLLTLTMCILGTVSVCFCHHGSYFLVSQDLLWTPGIAKCFS